MINYLNLVKKLSDENFLVREKATKDLIQLWPLCRGALLIGCQSSDPEIRMRCILIEEAGAVKIYGKQGRIFLHLSKRQRYKNRIDWLWKVQPEFVNFDMVDYSLEDETNKRMQALYLILCPFEDTIGLPWCPEKIHKKYWKDKKLTAALCDLVNDSWKNKDGSRILLACDPSIEVEGYDGYLGGLDNVRFWIRKLPDPSYIGLNGKTTKDYQKKWDKIKDEKYKEFEWEQ